MHTRRARRDIGLNSMAAGYQRLGLRLIHPHGSSYKPLHRDLEEAIEGGVPTGEAVGAVATDSVDDGNSSQVGEGAPSPAS
jgi:hypothetical protein